MSYDIYFVRREPGQSWESAVEALEGAEDSDSTDADIAAWDRLIPLVRGLFGDVDVFENPPSWAISHTSTGLEVSLFEGQWAVTVPYWTNGEDAAATMRSMYDVAEIVARETGLDGYDPQIGQPIAEVIDAPLAGQPFFDRVAQMFGRI